MTIKFNELDTKNIEVLVNDSTYGKLVFDDEQNAWVLWPESIDDGITYFDDLEETKEAIHDEIVDFGEEE